MGRLQDKVAIVIGASRSNNMGQAIARRFLAEGAKVVVSGRGQAGLDSFASETGALAHSCDIRRKPEVVALRDRVVEVHGGIDIAVNAAATGSYGPFEETTEEIGASIAAHSSKPAAPRGA